MKTRTTGLVMIWLALHLAGGMARAAVLVSGEAVTVGTVSSTSGGSLAAAGINGENVLVGELTGGARNYKGIFEFALPDLSANAGNIRVLDGTVKLFVSTSSANQDIYLRQISADGSVTTADYGSSPLNAGGLFLATGAPVNQYITFNVGNLIQTSVDNNQSYFAVRIETETPAYGSTQFRANIKGIHENVLEANVPLIEFNYEIIPEPSVAGLFVGGSIIVLLLNRRLKFPRTA